MAYHSVVNNNKFVESEVLPTLRALDADPEFGPLSFAMLVPSRLTRGYRSLVLASEKLDRFSHADAILRVYLAMEEKHLMARSAVGAISVLQTSNWKIQALSDAFQLNELGTAYEVGGRDIESLDYEQPIFLLSRPLPKAA